MASEIVPIITAAIGAVEAAMNVFAQVKTAAAQNGELTPDQDAAFDAQIAAVFASQAWKTDAQRKQA